VTDKPQNEYEMSDELKARYGLPAPPKGKRQKPFPQKVLDGQFGGRPYLHDGKGGFYNRGKWSQLPGSGYIPPSRRGPSGEPI
jgi:hypothetical protein